MAIKVLIDGKEVTFINDVRIVVDLDEDDTYDKLYVVATHEGLITDLTENGVVVVTKSEEYYDVVDRLDKYDLDTRVPLVDYKP
jgi:hypothetical protein